MDKGKIRTISIEDFKTCKESLDYYDTNVIAIQSQRIPLDMRDSIKLECFLFINCFKGEMKININGQDYLLNKGNSGVLLPGTILRKAEDKEPEQNSENSISLLGFSISFLNEFIHLKKETLNIALQLFNTPILPSGPIESYKFYLYKEMAYTLINDVNHVYHKEVLKHFFAALFCEMLNEINKVIPSHSKELSYNNNRPNWIFRQFIKTVLKDDGTHRSVAYYAEQLCYSPKHLSTVIKEISGKSPLKIINEHAIKQIKFHLKHSDKSMKELSEAFNFANPSFFGKFVKQHIGMSPMQYRNMQLQETEETPENDKP